MQLGLPPTVYQSPIPLDSARLHWPASSFAYCHSIALGAVFFSPLPHRYDAVMVSLSGHRYGNAQVFTNAQIGASNHSSFTSPSDGRGFFGRTSRAVFGQLFVRAKGLFACANTVSTFGRDKSAKSSRESSDRLDLYLLRCR